MLTRPSRKGASLVELLVVLAIIGVAAGAVTRVATAQQRHYRVHIARVAALGRLREGMDVLTTELMGVAPAAGDIHEMAGASVVFRAPLAAATVCAAVAPATSELLLAAFSANMDSTDTEGGPVGESWLAAGDSLWVHDAGADTAGASVGEAWHAHVVTAAVSARTTCLAPDSTEVPAMRATVMPAGGSLLEAGAPARAFRTARYALYRAGDGAWYLGFSDCRPLVRSPACAPIQPVAGPYLPAADPSRAGLLFEYLDAAGAPTDDRLAVVAIRMTLRANAAPAGLPADIVALTRTMAFRNTRR